MNRSTSRSIAVTTSWRPFIVVADRPNFECASRPASRATSHEKSSRFIVGLRVGIVTFVEEFYTSIKVPELSASNWLKCEQNKNKHGYC
jgi:hypothetical protein